MDQAKYYYEHKAAIDLKVLVQLAISSLNICSSNKLKLKM